MQTIQKSIIVPKFEFKLKIERDSDLAQMWYDDFVNNYTGVEVTVLESRQKTPLYIVGDHEKLAFNVSALNKMKKQELLELWELINDRSACIDEWTKKELIDDLKTLNMGDYYSTLWREGKTDDIKGVFSATGYSQGDYVEGVGIPSNDEPLKWFNSEYLSNLIFNQPLYIRLCVTDNETEEVEVIYIDESLKNCYEYDKAEILNALKSEKSSKNPPLWIDYAIEFCENNLPQYV